MVLLRCPRCGYVWEYVGRKKVFATCPDCYKKVKIAENAVREEEVAASQT